MAKINKYDRRHLLDLARIDRLIDNIYREAAREAAQLGVSITDFRPDSVFSFADYPQTQQRVRKLLDTLSSRVEGVIVSGVRSGWTLANNKNDELCRRVFGDNVGRLSQEQYRRYFSTNGEARDAFLARQVSGLSLSDRVWRYTNQFKDEIELGLDIGIRSGRSADALSRDLRQYLRHPDKLFRRVRDEHGQLQLSKSAAAFHPGQGVYRSSYKNARRLAATETNIAYRTSDHLRWQTMDFVVGIEIVTSNNHPDPDICDDLAGRYPKDFKFTGWHPHCRCHAVSILKTPEEMIADNERIMRGEEPSATSSSEVTDVPQKFKDWVVNNQERVARASSVPYFMRDNSRYVTSALEQAQAVPQAAQAVKAATFESLKADGWKTKGLEREFVEGIASQFDYRTVKENLTAITAQHGLTLEKFRVKVKSENEFLVGVEDDRGRFELLREFIRRPDGLEVHHSYFTLGQNLQGKGLSKEVFRLYHEQYKKMGVDFVTVDANIDVGGYCWARYGFRARNMGEALGAFFGHGLSKELRDKAQDFVEDWYTKNGLPASEPFPMKLITEQPWGKEALLGSYWEGICDLRKADHLRDWETYLGLR